MQHLKQLHHLFHNKLFLGKHYLQAEFLCSGLAATTFWLAAQDSVFKYGYKLV